MPLEKINKKTKGFLHFKDILKDHGLSATPSRIILIELLKNNKKPSTIQEIVDELKQTYQKEAPNWTTVYRNLIQFEFKKLVQSFDLGDGVKRYEWQHGNHHHHHIICNQCHRMEHFPECHIKPLEKTALKLGFQDITHRLELFGICSQCRSR